MAVCDKNSKDLAHVYDKFVRRSLTAATASSFLRPSSEEQASHFISLDGARVAQD